MTDALVIGRVGVDLTPPLPRTSLAAAESFIRSVGGFAGNIGIGLARLGVATAVVSGVGDDGHGEHIRDTFRAEGIDVRFIVTYPGSRTQVAFFEAWPPERFPVTFYRPSPAPDTMLTPADVPVGLIDRTPLVILSGAMLAAEPGRSTAVSVLERRTATRSDRRPSWTILDLDWRPALWSDPYDYPGLMAVATGLADVLIGGDEEFVAAGLLPERVQGPDRLVVLKHGSAGVSLLLAGRRHSVAGVAVDVVCGLGAGDAFTAAFAAGLLGGADPVAATERGNVAGAIVASRLTCSTSMPRPNEIDRLLERDSKRQEALP